MYQRINVCIPNDSIQEAVVCNYNFDDNNQFPLIVIDRGSYIGSGLVVDSTITVSLKELNEGIHNIQIGQFCSLAYNLFFTINRNHDYHRVSMAVSKLIQGSGKCRIKRKGQILIQNDVWIGHSCHIRDGVTIHNGAVVASNSNVVKDVPPYAIVGGNPAKIIGYRFNQDIVRKLLTIKWWDWSNEKIIENNRWFNEDIDIFCEKFYDEALKKNKKLNEIEITRLKNTYLFFADFNEPYCLWDKVLTEFIDTFYLYEQNLLILYIDEDFSKKNSSRIDEVNIYIDKLLINRNAKCSVAVCIDNKENEEAIFKSCNYYITNRSIKTVRHSCYADDNNVSIISGVDIPIFDTM